MQRQHRRTETEENCKQMGNKECAGAGPPNDEKQITLHRPPSVVKPAQFQISVRTKHLLLGTHRCTSTCCTSLTHVKTFMLFPQAFLPGAGGGEASCFKVYEPVLFDLDPSLHRS